MDSIGRPGKSRKMNKNNGNKGMKVARMQFDYIDGNHCGPYNYNV